MKDDAELANESAKNELRRHEETVYSERKKREIELQKMKKEAEEKKMQHERIEKRLVRICKLLQLVHSLRVTRNKCLIHCW